MKPKTEGGVTTAIVEPADRKVFDDAINRLVNLLVIEKNNPDNVRVDAAEAVIHGLRRILSGPLPTD